MKKIILFSVLTLCAMLAISCDLDLDSETNYTEDGHYGKVVIHNESASGRTITRITISDASLLSNTIYYNEPVSISSGRNSNVYKLELRLIYGLLFNGYTVTITLNDSTTKSKNISAYEDIVNHLYYNGTDLVERN